MGKSEEYPRTTKGMLVADMVHRLGLVNRSLEGDKLNEAEAFEVLDYDWIDEEDAGEIMYHPSIRAINEKLRKEGQTGILVLSSKLTEWQVVLEHAIAKASSPPEGIHSETTPNTAA